MHPVNIWRNIHVWLVSMVFLSMGFHLSGDEVGTFITLNFEVDGRDTRSAALYLPAGYSEKPDTSWPLIVYLHGGGGNGDNQGNAVNRWMKRLPIARAIEESPELFQSLVLMPRCPKGRIWSPMPANPVQSKWRKNLHGVQPIPDAENHITAAIQQAAKSYRVNSQQITISGHSMGGEGSIRYAALHPELIAGVASSAGSAIVVNEDAPILAKMGVWMFQGENDHISTAPLARKMAEAIQSAGGNNKYTEFTDTGHGHAMQVFGDPKVIQWLQSLKLPNLFRPLFNGTSLTGWNGNQEIWTIEDGTIVGNSHPKGMQTNTFLIADGMYSDFILRASFWSEGGGSGIQIRSKPAGEPDEFRVVGYQADIGGRDLGTFYEEKGRGTLALSKFDALKPHLNPDGWNTYQIHAVKGNFKLTVNGITTATYSESSISPPLTGKIALQLQAGAPMKAKFKDVEIFEFNK